MQTELELEAPQKALDVLAHLLREPYSDEDVEQAATIWEQTNGAMLLRPWETMEQFIARASEFKTDVKALTLNMDAGTAKLELDRILQGVDDPKALSPEHQQRVNELEAILGRPKMNFEKSKTRAEIMDAAKIRYAQYVREPDFAQRVQMVVKEKNRVVIEFLIKYESNDTVREAAMRRLGEIDVLGA